MAIGGWKSTGGRRKTVVALRWQFEKKRKRMWARSVAQ